MPDAFQLTTKEQATILAFDRIRATLPWCSQNGLESSDPRRLQEQVQQLTVF